MRLEKVVLENFRSYKDRITIDINDLTAFIGKNDIGKSTILEALEIFFNNETVKIEQEDSCVHTTSDKVLIGCVFSDVPTYPIVIDASAGTTLQQEFLLNNENLFEIHKVYDCSKKSVPHDIYIISNFPSIQGASDLLELTQAQLKKRVKDLGIDESVIDLRSNVSIRQAIYNSFTDLNLTQKAIQAKGDVKSIWEKLNPLLPIYSLFQSDRPSLDDDSEVQDPMKLAIKEALQLVEEQLTTIKDTVQKKAIEVASNTVEKLKDMDENLANQLKPHFSEEPKWDKIFKLSLDGDNDIPINKRGSGVRRLILLNFFRAEAERKIAESGIRNVIYAIEEPETAQHPTNQIMLAEALMSLSENPNTQILLTTHVPGFAGLLPTSSIRYIKETSSVKEILNANMVDDTLHEVAEALGVLPPPIDDSIKVLVFVEGIHDVETIKTFSKIVSQHNPNVIDLTESNQAVVMPSGGSTLKGWVENQYLKSFGLPEVHIYDSDNKTPPKYQDYCDKVNSRGDGSVAFSTKKREMENYISPKAIKEVLGIEVAFTSQCDVPNLLAKLIHESDPSSGDWEQLKPEKKKQKESNIKKKLNNEVVKAMTYEQLCEIDNEKEVENWLITISSFCNETVTN